MLHEQIYKDYVQAMKARDKKRSEFLSYIRGELKNVAIDLKKDNLEDNEVLTVLNKQKKRLSDAKAEYEKSNRTDLIDDLNQELRLLSEYLPEQLSEEKVNSIVDEVIAETSASSMKDMGMVMKQVLAKVGVSADAKLVSAMVKEKLSK